MPQLGETVTEGTITKWHKQVGDVVAEDEVLFEVSTDKVDSEVPSPFSGTVTEILVPEGETVAVGSRLAVVGSVGDVAAAAARAEGGATAGKQGPGAGPDGTVVRGTAAPAVPASPEEASAVSSEEMESIVEEGTGQPGAGWHPLPAQSQASTKPPTGGPPRPGARPSDQRPPSAPAQGGLSRLLSPVVRRLIAEHGLDPSRIVGSGAGGRITRDDVLAAIERQDLGINGSTGAGVPDLGMPDLGMPDLGMPDLGMPDLGIGAGLIGTGPARVAEEVPPAPSSYTPADVTTEPGSSGPGSSGPASSGARERDTVVPFTNIRRRTAEHMVRSKQTSAHTMLAVDVDYSAVERARLAQRSRFKAEEGFSLTYLPFVARAVIDALEQWPYLNSSVGDNELVVHGDVNLGVAVDLDFEGLLVPVVHRAQDKRLVALAREIHDLASRARSKRLTMDDISGGTFTITNAGGFGTFITVPVINQPQVAILSTDGVRKRPVAVELPDGSDGIAVHPVGNLVLSWDHRAVDGSYAAAFMARAREVLETRDWAAEL
jgi:2-oxoglutarate dehydrogenase E2 component (dihydrolipoamide succinyltransferase)